MNLVNKAFFEEMELLGVSWEIERNLVMLGRFRVGFMPQNNPTVLGGPEVPMSLEHLVPEPNHI